ncbi:hypothetical protein HWV03_08610 [Moritella sp. 36]|uniref:hypothetical protein n=1 Tax=Moritella sp. 36 TaxID=2746233 RepID=UPI001BAE396D|nr:hypothetical protein [Moritella sp. 36]QUM88854.1 hypothetical protein HWV03_08610 [Moritella sp. 36]
MNNSWHNTSDYLGKEEYSMDFWTLHSEELKSGEFWENRRKNYKGKSGKKLTLALKNMPFPASFHKAAVATRGLIREKRKVNEPYDEQLYLLYWLAAIESFSIPYSQNLKEPGHNVFYSIPRKTLQRLQFTYQTLGYKDLNLLNKTDIKWLIDTWGEPTEHNTLHKMHIDVWKEYENKLKAKRSSKLLDFSLNVPKSTIKIEKKSKIAALTEKNNNCKMLLFLIGVIVIVTLTIIGKN